MEVSPQPPLKRTKRLTSVVWNDFERVKKDEIMVAICKHCKKKLSGSSTSGTSHLRNHLKRCLRRTGQDISQQLLVVREKKKERTTDLGNFKFDKEQSSVDLKFDQERSLSDLAHMIILHGYPLSMVEHTGFKKFVANLQPSFQILSRDTAQAECLQIYQKEKHKVYQMLDKVSGRFSLTIDVWTSYQGKRYLCLTARYINDAWQLQQKILNFLMVDPATDEAFCEAIMTCLMDWDIDRRLFSITSENCSTTDNSIFSVRDRLSTNSSASSNGQLFHVRCAAHILYLCVQDVFEELHEITEKIRESLRHVKASEAIQQKDSDVAFQVNILKNISLDCPTKWGSTYLMLEAAVRCKDAFSYLQESGFTMAPSRVEWERVTVVTNCLKLFYDVSNVFSGVKYPTANLYFPEMCNIHLELVTWCNSSNVFVKNMASKIKQKFDAYWSISSLSLAITAVLDPRFKMKLVEYYFSQIYGSRASEHIEEVFHGINGLYNEYALQPSMETVDHGLTSAVQNGNGLNGISSTVTDGMMSRLSGFDKFLHESSNSPQKNSDLENYLEEQVFPRNMDFDILNWWKVNSPKYPVLSLVARDVLGIPLSIEVASSSTFDSGGKVLDSHRSSLSPDVLQALICTHDWLQEGF